MDHELGGRKGGVAGGVLEEELRCSPALTDVQLGSEGAHPERGR